MREHTQKKNVVFFLRISKGVNGCFSSPCKNGGTCYGNSDTYRCECVDPWSGPLCEISSGIITTTEDPTGTPGKPIFDLS